LIDEVLQVVLMPAITPVQAAFYQEVMKLAGGVDRAELVEATAV